MGSSGGGTTTYPKHFHRKNTHSNSREKNSKRTGQARRKCVLINFMFMVSMKLNKIFLYIAPTKHFPVHESQSSLSCDHKKSKEIINDFISVAQI